MAYKLVNRRHSVQSFQHPQDTVHAQFRREQKNAIRGPGTCQPPCGEDYEGSVTTPGPQDQSPWVYFTASGKTATRFKSTTSSIIKKLYTKQGDEGDTGLLYGGRISKADPRTEAYGTVDEAVSALGLARSLSRDTRVREAIEEIQRELFTVGAELATDPAQYDKLQKHFDVVTPQATNAVESRIDEFAAEVNLPPQFVIPGGSQASAALDVARTVVRRAERRAVELNEDGLIANPEVLRYLNRISDLLFILARYMDKG
jgi:cob(I)alamin adenosyltransferase